jgi:hypothetical protein
MTGAVRGTAYDMIRKKQSRLDTTGRPSWSPPPRFVFMILTTWSFSFSDLHVRVGHDSSCDLLLTGAGRNRTSRRFDTICFTWRRAAFYLVDSSGLGVVWFCRCDCSWYRDACSGSLCVARGREIGMIGKFRRRWWSIMSRLLARSRSFVRNLFAR